MSANGRAAPIAVRSAEISTATVEIKTVTVNGKQMTLAMFRQLREVPLIDGHGKLNGNPWGTVNYHPATVQEGPAYKPRKRIVTAGNCQLTHAEPGFLIAPCNHDHGEHLHVIWQRGGELLKSMVHERDWCHEHPGPDRRLWSPAVAAVLQGWYCAGGHKLPEWAREVGKGRDREVVFDCEGVRCYASAPMDHMNLPAAPWAPDWSGECPAVDLPALSAELAAQARQAARESEAEDARKRQYAATWQALTDLPQLFIAA